MTADDDVARKILGESHVPEAPAKKSHTGGSSPQTSGPFEPGFISLVVPAPQQTEPEPQPPSNSPPPKTQPDE